MHLERQTGFQCQLAAFCSAMEELGYDAAAALTAWPDVNSHPAVEEQRQRRHRRVEDEADVETGSDHSEPVRRPVHTGDRQSEIAPWRIELRAGFLPGQPGAPTREQVQAACTSCSGAAEYWQCCTIPAPGSAHLIPLLDRVS
eukprot:gene11614-20167_t